MAAQYSADGRLMTDDHKCFMANLGYKSTAESLTAYFSKFGEVDHCKVIYDSAGASKGFGFLWMKKKEDCVKVAQAAIPDGFTIDGRFGVHANYHNEGPKYAPQPGLPPPVNPDAPIQVDIEVDPDAPIPVMFKCGIDEELMDEPVTAADGHSYERFNIERHLKRKKTSPKTGDPLDHTMLVPNNALKMMIDAWKKKHAINKDGVTASPTVGVNLSNVEASPPDMPSGGGQMPNTAVATAVAKAFLAAAQVPKDDNEKWEVCCKNIPQEMEQEDLKTLMEQFGDIHLVKIVASSDVGNKGYAFVRFKNAEAMNDALEKGGSGVSWNQQFIAVLPANRKRTQSEVKKHIEKVSETGGRHQIFIRNMPFTLTAEDLSLLFGPFGSILSTKILTEPDPNKPGMLKSRGIGFVEFANEQEMLMAVHGGNDISISGRNLIVQDADRKKARAPTQQPIVPPAAVQQPQYAAYPQYAGYAQPQQHAYPQQAYGAYPVQQQYPGYPAGYPQQQQQQYAAYAQAVGAQPIGALAGVPPSNNQFTSVPDVVAGARPDEEGGGKRMRYE
ncbi:hypothetical protein TL16_g11507 [Triparma laevis f. inornata]|uniref:Uncharacterized protein n=1 Tax=Triparma laevis f. inornata TaxID=1714386 RepID=A0A9W7BN16_9STRA|nr:hypothetical protein TL16_g11507 [Triparma laevis f. inornata]